MRLFSQINVRGTTVLVATHDVDLIQETGRRCLTLDRGRRRRRARRGRPPAAGRRERRDRSVRLPRREEARRSGRRLASLLDEALSGLWRARRMTRRLDPPDLVLALPRRPLPPRGGEPRRRRRRRSATRRPSPSSSGPAPTRRTTGGPRARRARLEARRRGAARLARGGAGAASPGAFASLAARRGRSPANPFPASVELDLLPGGGLLRRAPALPREPRGEHRAVEEVQFDVDWIRRLRGVVRLVAAAGLGAAVLLALGAAFTIANVVRLTILLHRDEIEILRLVGAPEFLIRGPFLLGGVLQGLLGGARRARRSSPRVPGRSSSSSPRRRTSSSGSSSCGSCPRQRACFSSGSALRPGFSGACSRCGGETWPDEPSGAPV